ncbi:hypothetical protein MUN76_15360 [Leucobacter rhizosphaerae]|uniref:Major tail protein n=1 Tax=Leucobacter rhizosphaerae TaxID=2932245 RepID=A0ABY4FVP8_9MICO|nr:hypothetical protein [Leucobacter rhizosphaerae]UOQ60386.1 hypothetical protein MUN76_15360 [Leucobacter rhizosphaerae]
MALEEVQPGVAADGNGLVLWVPAIADPSAPKVSELTAAGVEKLTYGLTPDGFAHDTSVATITSGRYTLAQALELDGVITDTVEVKYVWEGTEDDGVRNVLTPGTKGFIVKRMAVPNATAIAAAQMVTVIPVQCSIQRDVPPAANTELQKIQKLNVVGEVQRDVAVVAGP